RRAVVFILEDVVRGGDAGIVVVDPFGIERLFGLDVVVVVANVAEPRLLAVDLKRDGGVVVGLVNQAVADAAIAHDGPVGIQRFAPLLELPLADNRHAGIGRVALVGQVSLERGIPVGVGIGSDVGGVVHLPVVVGLDGHA